MTSYFPRCWECWQLAAELLSRTFSWLRRAMLPRSCPLSGTVHMQWPINMGHKGIPLCLNLGQLCKDNPVSGLPVGVAEAFVLTASQLNSSSEQFSPFIPPQMLILRSLSSIIPICKTLRVYFMGKLTHNTHKCVLFELKYEKYHISATQMLCYLNKIRSYFWLS